LRRPGDLALQLVRVHRIGLLPARVELQVIGIQHVARAGSSVMLYSRCGRPGPGEKGRPRRTRRQHETRNALLRSRRYRGERGFALMSQRWRALQRVMVSPTTIGDIAKSVLVLVQFEHKMIS